jgi:hypothetical protein
MAWAALTYCSSFDTMHAFTVGLPIMSACTIGNQPGISVMVGKSESTVMDVLLCLQKEAYGVGLAGAC